VKYDRIGTFQTPSHTFQPLLYQVATDELAPTEVGLPIRELLHGRKNIAFHRAVVRNIDLATGPTVDPPEVLHRLPL
jgi:NADH dehydrogenase FAD-containing subunit